MARLSKRLWPKKLRYFLKQTRDGRSQQEIGRAAGMGGEGKGLANALSDGRELGIDAAIGLARTLGASADWLFDDAVLIDDLPKYQQQRATQNLDRAGLLRVMSEALAFAAESAHVEQLAAEVGLTGDEPGPAKRNAAAE